MDLSLPKSHISILIPIYNTPSQYIRECFASILHQQGAFCIELVIVNDGSNAETTETILQTIDMIETRQPVDNLVFTVVYREHPENLGISAALNWGVTAASNEIVFRMDADDIMSPDRIAKQYDFITLRPYLACCGGNMHTFYERKNHANGLPYKQIISTTNMEEHIILQEYVKTRKDWIMNHPTLVFRRSAVLEVGNYNIENRAGFEDLELELKLLKRDGVLENMPDILLLYRLHDAQVTQKNRGNTEAARLRGEMIDELLL